MELSGVRLNSAQPWGIPWMALGVMLSIASLFAVNSLELIGATWVAIAGARIALRVNVFPVLLALVFPFLEIVTSVLDAEGHEPEFKRSILRPWTGSVLDFASRTLCHVCWMEVGRWSPDSVFGAANGASLGRHGFATFGAAACGIDSVGSCG